MTSDEKPLRETAAAGSAGTATQAFATQEFNAAKPRPAGESPPSEVAEARVVILDDEPLNVRLIQHQLRRLGYRSLLGISDSTAAMQVFEDYRPDVVLMDLVMPGLSGPELLREMRLHEEFHSLPVVVLTASTDRAARLNVLSLGVSDFLGKPVDEAELATRLSNVLSAKRYRDHLSQWAQQLESAVKQRTRELEVSRQEVVFCLARAAEFRDDNTGKHVVRVGRYTAILAESLGFPAAAVDLIEIAAQLHDVGKIGIPDAILHKPGVLSDEEMTVMKRHAEFGCRIIGHTATSGGRAPGATTDSPMLQMAARIARSHHERWDGTGYPLGLSGTQIPLEGRITALADVFDALSTARVYKPAFSLTRCYQIIQSERGRHFDPQVVDAFFDRRQRIEDTYLEMASEDLAP